MDDDLEAELLAVTAPSANKQEKEYSDNSDSDARDSDVPESDRDDSDVDSRQGDEDDDLNDDDDEPDDEDDDDYSVGGKKKSSRKPSAKKKRPASKSTKRKKPQKKKASPAPRKRPNLNLDDVDDDDENEDEFKYEYDEYGYGDAQDRENLMRMTEVERETLLEDRMNERRKRFDLWQVKRDMQKQNRGSRDEPISARRSGRSKVNTKSAAMNDMLDKDKKASRVGEVSDADSEPDRDRKRSRSSPTTEDQRRDTQSHSRDDDEEVKPDKGPDICYEDLVRDDGANISTTLLFARRTTLIKLSQLPGFARAVKGLFVRVRVSGPETAYLLCRVADVELGKAYTLQNNIRTDYYLVLQSGMQKRTFSIAWCSGSHPNPHEFDTYKSRLLHAGGALPERPELDALLKKAESFIVKSNAEVSEEERRVHRAQVERLYPEQVNWTVKRTDVQMALDVKQQDYERAKLRGDNAETEALRLEVERKTAELNKVLEMERKYVRKETSTNAMIFQELAAKNRAENMRMDRLASIQQRRRSSAVGGTKEINPYSRVETTGQGYYHVPGDANSKKEERPVKAIDKRDWRSGLVTWKACDVKRTISSNPIQPHYGIPLAGLDDLVWPPRPRPSQDVSAVPKRGLCVDAVYAAKCGKRKRLPEGAKIISIENWNAAGRQ